MDFGFSNDPKEIEKIETWRDAAIADGWEHKPTYNSEAESRACSLSKDGFKASMLTRRNEPGSKKWLFEANVHVWGPDGMCVQVDFPYSFESIIAGVNKCGNCNREGVKTHLAGFAGRFCAECLPLAKKKLEYPGWCD